MKPTFEDYRIRITHVAAHYGPLHTYIVRRSPRLIQYYSANEMPLALSNLVQAKSAELRFALEDARTGAEAAKAIRAVLGEQWAGNKYACPTVEVL